VTHRLPARVTLAVAALALAHTACAPAFYPPVVYAPPAYAPGPVAPPAETPFVLPPGGATPPATMCDMQGTCYPSAPHGKFIMATPRTRIARPPIPRRRSPTIRRSSSRPAVTMEHRNDPRRQRFEVEFYAINKKLDAIMKLLKAKPK
jgi:hypothetical protein